MDIGMSEATLTTHPIPCVPQGKVPASNILASAPSDKNLGAWRVSGAMGMGGVGVSLIVGSEHLFLPHWVRSRQIWVAL